MCSVYTVQRERIFCERSDGENEAWTHSTHTIFDILWFYAN